ncbi:MAG TPA: hypothetical protein VIK13_06920 [Candidatus Limnocylindrales bacterium]
MQTEGGDTGRDARALEGALDEALASLPDVDRGAAPDRVDYRWLSIGLRLAMERPEQARHLLEMIGAQDADREAPPQADAGGVSPAGGPDTEGPGGSAPVPVPSMILARSAAMSLSERAGVGPEVTFGWAARLTPSEILRLGRVVHEMLASGAPPDIGRGFGLAWDAGVRIPRQESDAMFREFTALEVTVGSVLAGHDLRAAEPARQPQGLGALLGQLVPRARPEASEAAAALNGSGEPGRKGLVALWNAWAAMRYRSLISRPMFELLVRPWVTVVGPLPEP